jgi:hypothetical protein
MYFQALLRKPALVARQVETYGQIAIEELSVESTRLKQWMARTIAAALLAAVGVMLAGVAVLLWAVEHNRVALLWIVPAAFLLVAWVLKAFAGPAQGLKFPVLRQQLAEDRALFASTASSTKEQE